MITQPTFNAIARPTRIEPNAMKKTGRNVRLVRIGESLGGERSVVDRTAPAAGATRLATRASCQNRLLGYHRDMDQRLRIRKVVLYKHGVGFFEREGRVDGSTELELAFKTADISDVLKSLTVLDLDGGHVSSISYDALTPARKLLEDLAIGGLDGRGLLAVLPQIQGAEIEIAAGSERLRGRVLGVDIFDRDDGNGIVPVHWLSVLTDSGETLRVDVVETSSIRLLDEKVRRDLEFYLRTTLAAKKQDARQFTLFAQGEGERRLRVSYTVETPVWKATYRILLPREDTGDEPLIQGWAVVDNTQDEDWDEVELSLISGLPISFVHDLYRPRYVRRPVVAVEEQASIAPPAVQEASARLAARMPVDALAFEVASLGAPTAGLAPAAPAPRMVSSVDVQTRERQVGDLFQYAISRPVTIKRNQSALVPIVLKPFGGQQVLLYNPENRPRNPLSAVEFENTTGLTLEGGPVTVIDGDTYSGEAMIETIKPEQTRIIPYSVELAVLVDGVADTRTERIHRTRIAHGVLWTFAMERRQTVYTISNQSGRKRTLYLEHRRHDNWDLFETPSPHETTPDFHRFRIEIAESGATGFTVTERIQISQTFSVQNFDSRLVADYRSARFFDDRVSAALHHVLTLKDRVAQIDVERAEAARELAAIAGDQQRIRENLKSIGDGIDEKRLRATLVEKLIAQEQRLEQLTAAQNSLELKRQQAQAEVDAAISSIEFEGEV